MKTGKFLLIMSAFLITVFMSISAVSIPHLINYQGKLSNAEGDPLEGTYSMRFRLYNVLSGGSAIWDETQSVHVMDGIYNVQLGAMTPLSVYMFTDDLLYLEVTVSGSVLSPRQRITSTAFAMIAGDADTLDGLDAEDLDQSGHVSRTDNPHSVTAAQIGAASISDITWNNLAGIPTGFADGLDDTGIQTETDPTVAASVKDGVSWGELSGIPAGFADGLDNTGIQTETDPTVPASVKDGVSWGELSGIPAGFADNVDNVGSLNLPYIGWLTSDQAAFWITNHGGFGTAIWGLSSANNGNGVVGQTDASTGVGVLGKHKLSGNYAELGVAMAAVHAVGFGSSAGIHAQGVIAGRFIGNLDTTGNLGIGTMNPMQALHIVGINPRILVEGTDSSSPELNFKSSTGNNWALYKHGTAGDLRFYQSGDKITIQDTTGNVGIGTTNPVQKLTVRGNLLIQSASTGTSLIELGEGLDYAEGFHVSDKAEIMSGSVLIIDSEQPGKLMLSNSPYNTKVAGIVAGAKGLGSAVRLGVGQFDYDVALAGRVYCNVDANYGEVNPGDLLTTSPTSGYAMVVKDRAKAQGAILGKAMEKLEQGKKGQILVLVTLQ